MDRVTPAETRAQLGSFERAAVGEQVSERRAFLAVVKVISAAYEAGHRDGLAWDLDGFADPSLVYYASAWDEATINAIGAAACAREWGVPETGEAWETACREYSAGAHAGVTAPQAERSGLPPGGKVPP